MATTLLGRALGLALRDREPLTPVTASRAALVGTMAAVVIFGWLSFLGLSAPRILVAEAALLAVLLADAARAGHAALFVPRGPARHWLLAVLPALCLAGLGLLPLLHGGDLAAGSDTFIYCSFAEWLQAHGFRDPVPAPLSPVTFQPDAYGRAGLRVAGSYLLALTQAASGSVSLAAYPAVSAWGLLLQAAAVALLMRSLFQPGPAQLVAYTIVFAALPHASYWSHHQGFLAQLYGSAALLFVLALFADGHRAGGLGRRGAFQVALGGAFLLGLYLPLLPCLAAAALASTAVRIARSPSAAERRRIVRWAGLVILLFAALSACDLPIVPGALRVFASANVGAHVSWPAADLAAFAMGAAAPARLNGAFEGAVRWPILGLGGALCLLGLRAALRREQGAAVAATAATLACALSYYALLDRDPWTQSTGHTWNVLKLLKWLYPVAFVLQVWGAACLPAPARRVLAAAVIAVVFLSLPAHWSWSDPGPTSLRRISGDARPVLTLADMRSRLSRLPPGPLVLAEPPTKRHPWFGPYFALLAFPRPVIADWSDGAYITEELRERAAREARSIRPSVAISCADVRRPTSVDVGWGCSVDGVFAP